jgi:hypothetical protein
MKTKINSFFLNTHTTQSGISKTGGTNTNIYLHYLLKQQSQLNIVFKKCTASGITRQTFGKLDVIIDQ